MKQDIEKPGHVCGGVGGGDCDLLSYNFVRKTERLGRFEMAQWVTKWPRHTNKSTRTTAQQQRTNAHTDNIVTDLRASDMRRGRFLRDANSAFFDTVVVVEVEEEEHGPP